MANGNPFSVQAIDLSGIGRGIQQYQQRGREEDQQAKQLQARQSAFQLLSDSQQAQDPEQRKQLFMQAFQADPEMVKGYKMAYHRDKTMLGVIFNWQE